MSSDDERIKSLQEVAGRFLFFAQQGMISSGKFSPGEITVGLAQVATISRLSTEDWQAILSASTSFYQEAQEAKGAVQS